MNLSPSPRQLEVFDRAPAGRAVLFYQCSHREPAAAADCRAALATLAARHHGRLRWAAREEEILVGRIEPFQEACRIHFRTRGDARRFFDSAAHRTALAQCTALQVAVLSEQPRMLALASAVLAALLPRWPFDNSIETDEEPGLGSSTVMPAVATVAALRAHPDQDSPLVMINWLRFRPAAGYPDGEAPATGRTAYLRYGKVALVAAHSLGGKLIFGARYRQMLIGHGGDPATGLWDEFALMQYPGRRSFGLMASLRRYRKALHHREAGLAEYGQGLTVSRPLPGFVWRR